MASFRDTFWNTWKEKGSRAFRYRFEWNWLRLVDITDSRTFEYTATSSPTAIAVDHIGDRPVAAMAGANGADDGHCFQLGTGATDGSMQFVADKMVMLRFGVRTAHATAATPEFLIGWYAAPTVTAPIANIGSLTDYFLVNKLTAETVFSVEARSASGTAESTSLAETAIATNTWQDYEVYIWPDAGTAGKAKVEVWRATANGPMLPVSGTISNPDYITISSQLPTTVDMTFGLAMEAGDTGTDVSYFCGGEIAQLA